ncbi:FAD-binding domain-containing protein [Glutamicibacter sp. M10]|uniref:FAD-binding domain-containing protein n=1 Tax=Glutamicibacter sp. M10 TaxID=3023076 RepID=UPI0037C11631
MVLGHLVGCGSGEQHGQLAVGCRQWGGCCPYFRVFNPELQAKKFDPSGSYVAAYAPLAVEPVVDLKESRQMALDAYQQMKSAKGQ